MAIHDDTQLAVVATVSPNAYEASLEFLEGLTSKCEETQQKVLSEILNQNVNTGYLKRYNVSHGSLDRETFKANVPIVTYEDIKDDILRMYNGDSSPILCAQPISEFWLSSGTSGGQEKFLPATEDDKVRRHTLLTSVMPFIKGRIEGSKPYKGKGFSLIITRDEARTPTGKILCSGMNSVFKNSKFYNDKPYPNNFNTSPLEAIYCSDHFQSVYAQLLCGFYQRYEVTHAKAVFGSTLLWIMHFLKSNYSELCSDITSGTLNPKIVDPSLRSFMVNTFVNDPNPELSKVIEDVCSKDDWEGIFRKIWPNIKYVETVVTGSMAQYIPMLNYYSGGLPLVSVKYSSSECDLGFNLNPMCDPNDISYTIMPNMAYYEFVPLELEDSTSSDTTFQTVDLANVEIGKEYELLITTYCGLYRYRMGDVLIPTSFYNSTPQFKFLRRRNVILTVDIAKTTEVELQNGIDRASSLLRSYDTKIVEYTSYADVKTSPGHYIIYLELMTTMSPENLSKQEVLEHCCLAMEGCLGVYYRSCRVDEAIGPLEIRVVRNGSFEKLRDYAISKGASFLQFKVPRCVKSLPMLELLDSCVISSCFSASLPRKSA